METVEEWHGMTESVRMAPGRTMRTHRTYTGPITRTIRPVRMAMTGAIIGTVIGTMAVVRTMTVARAVVAGTMVGTVISARTIVIALIAGMLRTVATRAVVIALIARAVVSVAGAVLMAAVLMAIIRGAPMRRTRRPLTCSVA